MMRGVFSISAALILIVIFVMPLAAQNPQPAQPPTPIPIKVVVVAMFERGEDTGDAPGEYQLWVEREHLDQILPLDAGYHHVRLNKDGVLGLLTGVGTAKAAASVMALGLDPRFDLSKAYWLVAGIGGGDPADVSLGSAVWIDHMIDSDYCYEIDAREIPIGWLTGRIPMNHATPYEQPVTIRPGDPIYTLNPQLVAWALALTKDVPLADTDGIRTARARWIGFPNATRPPFVTHGDGLSGSTFWHGTLFDNWANAWVQYYLGGQANFVESAMEDTGTLQTLTFLSNAGRIDMKRVLVLRTISNFDQQAPSQSAEDSLKQMATGNYAAYMESLEAAERVGDKVVRDIVDHWPDRESTIPSAPVGVQK
ncbi:MAG TPA: purine nucleoside permease [Candidatus Acidoferrales bacterium]|nr:purine nucleoside permease [Candidatus Acidoferrales bacterium]